MDFVPYDYQTYGKNFIIDHPYCGLFLSMGLGKTVTTAWALWELCLDYFSIARILVVAPKRVARDTWPGELTRWSFLAGLSYSVVMGSEKQRIAALKKKAFVYIINRENLCWLVDSGYFDFDCVVLDESSSFKSHQAKRYKAMRQVRPNVKRMIELSGTPAPNSLMDLWAQINLLDMGQRLGRYITHYRDRYFVPDKRNKEIVFSYKPKEGAEEAIYRAISDICISMKSGDYIKLPDVVESNVEVEMSAEERKFYDRLKQDLILTFPDGDIDATSAVGLSNKLLQMAGGSCYDENGQVKFIHERKLDALEDLIEAANGEPVLVAVWFKHEMERVIKRFGAVPIDKSEDIKKWNEGKIPVAVIHPAAAGHGLNLQAGGHHLIWFSQCWSLELTQQTNARLARLGQKETVTIQHIVTKDTIDEDVMRALKSKDFSQEALLSAVKARIGG